jgi:DNA-binding HxlR family transcriptional regulator
MSPRHTQGSPTASHVTAQVAPAVPTSHARGGDIPVDPTPSAHVHSPTECPAVREVLNRIGDKWSVQLVALLQHGPKRFSDLRRSIEGISQRMLTLTLRGLERDGMVTRTIFPTIPPRVDYALTPLGKTLLEPILALAAWAESHRFEIQAARERYDDSHEPRAEPEA